MLLLHAYVFVLQRILMSDSCHCEQVGQKISIMISSVDKARSNVVISEKKAWVSFKVVTHGIDN